jgi:hypothetical protein
MSAVTRVLRAGAKTRSPHEIILRHVRRNHPADLLDAKFSVGLACSADYDEVAAFINVTARQLLYSQLQQPPLPAPMWKLVCCYWPGFGPFSTLYCVISELEIRNVLGRCARYGIKLGIAGYMRVSPEATDIIQRDVVPQLPNEEVREVRSRLANGFRRGWDLEDDEDDKVEEVVELERSNQPMLMLDAMMAETWEQDWVASS